MAVRAIAPVTGMPPTSGTIRLATPCASSSAFELWRSPVIESATTADSRLSTAARSATVSADGSSGRIRSARNCGMAKAGRPLGMPPNFDPIVSTGRPNTATAAVPASSATIDPGSRGSHFGTSRISASDPVASANCERIDRRQRAADRAHAGEELARIAGQRQAEEVLDLRRGDEQRDAVREAEDDRAAG